MDSSTTRLRGQFSPLATLIAALLGAGCAPTAQPTAEECAAATVSAGGEQGTPDELSELMAELIAPRICEQVVGHFIGLPGDEGHEGPAAGSDPSVGRWWIRRCRADVDGQRLRVAIGGPGWTWLDRESMGFRVHQYLRFEGEATFSASLHVGYDANTRLASIWLTPADGVRAQVEPTGLVQAESTGVFSSLLGGILDMTGESASDRARQQASEEGSQRLTERFGAGFTVTFQLDSQQMDFMLGALDRGQTPERPWGNIERAWLVNERSSVWPGGMDVLGPIDADAGEVQLDLELEEGDGAVIRRVCEDDLHAWLDGAWNGQRQGPPRGDTVAEPSATHQPSAVRLEAQDCRSLLVVTPRANASVPATLRYRLLSLDAAAASPGTTVVVDGSGTTGSTTAGSTTRPPAAVRPRTVRVMIRSVSVASQTASGGNWDMLGGAPDPYVVVSSISQGREIHRTTVHDDTREATINQWLPGAVRLDQFPLRFVIYDDDVAGDEVVGSADLESARVTGTETDLALDIRSNGDRPSNMGTLRIRLQPVD